MRDHVGKFLFLSCCCAFVFASPSKSLAKSPLELPKPSKHFLLKRTKNLNFFYQRVDRSEAFFAQFKPRALTSNASALFLLQGVGAKMAPVPESNSILVKQTYY